MEHENNNEINSFLTFKVGGENFAANVKQVRNIVEVTKITKVPQAPEYMLGVINLRGSILPVIDSRIKFGMPISEFTKNTFIIVMQIIMDNKEVDVGILVDAVNEVVEMDSSKILPPPNVGGKFKTDYIFGVLNINDNFIMILDIERIFSTEEIIDIKENIKN